MDKLDITSIERIKLAGAFGNYIDPKYAMVIGLVPDCALDKVAGVGNAAGTGAAWRCSTRPPPRDRRPRASHREDRDGAGAKVPGALRQRHGLPNKVEAFPLLAAAVPLPAKRGDAPDGEGDGRRRRGRARRAAEEADRA
jgi:uncharacterized 2Fe-2S/4Fe-4S cluster protein (DUF4445 family)